MDFGTASVKSSPKQSPVQHVVISNTAKNTMADYGFDFFSTESQATKAPNVSLVPVNNQVLIEVNDSASKESLPAIPKKFAPQATDESDDWVFCFSTVALHLLNRGSKVQITHKKLRIILRVQQRMPPPLITLLIFLPPKCLNL